MNLTPLPVDTVTDDEWRAACAVRAARDTAGYFPALTRLDAICGTVERALRVQTTVDDAHRCLARAAHPAGMFLGHGSHALPEHHPVDDRTPGAGEPMDPGMIAAGAGRNQCSDTGRRFDSVNLPPRPVERRTASRAPGDRPTTEARGVGAPTGTPPRWSAADRLIYTFGVLCLAVIVGQLMRGGW